MALKIQSSYAAGELDPALQERTTLEKYKSGLGIGRNVIVAKTGRVITRPGRKTRVQTKLPNRRALIFSSRGINYLFEWGHLYVRTYDPTTFALIDEAAHLLTENDLDNIQFQMRDKFSIYVFVGTSDVLVASATSGALSVSSVFSLTATLAPTTPTVVAAGAPAGYNCDYLITRVDFLNQESQGVAIGGQKYPQANGQQNTITVQAHPGTVLTNTKEIRVYRRPQNGGAFGFLGSSTYLYAAAGNTNADFIDVGGAADYAHTPPDHALGGPPLGLRPQTGTIYQQRLIITDIGTETIGASRPGIHSNFYRDFPLSADSGLKFRAGSAGLPIPLRMIDSDGLVVFTTIGVYLHVGPLSPTNLALDKKGEWVIDTRVPPLSIPGGVVFVDKATNTVRVLSWSTETASYTGREVSIFSDHLFLQNRIVSWGFQDGALPVLWVAFKDGNFASFTYERDQEMRAWTHHDSKAVKVEYIATNNEKSFFLVNKNGTRYIEEVIPRYVRAEDRETYPEIDMDESIGPIDSLKVFKTILNTSLVGTDQILIDSLNPDDWSGTLSVKAGTSPIFLNPGAGTVGTILRVFDSDQSAIDLTVTEWLTSSEIRVTPSREFPQTRNTNPNVFLPATTFTGLDHLEGEFPMVIVDGSVIASPNNDVESYDQLQVVGGTLVLPDNVLGAIVVVGRPVICDIGTLDIDTVEQRPILIESQTINKVYIRTYRSRGLYIGGKFPANDMVTDMQQLDSYPINEDTNNATGYRHPLAKSERREVTLPGDWKSNGRLAIRQVDGLHAEILSIIPDVQDLRR